MPNDMINQTIYSRFKEVADSQPAAPAIIEDDHMLTYAELDDLCPI
jgi:non-ribosomal peptide synthetase component E (peptide arylation enzyme)